MIGQTISHYKILAKLGGGGMGIVYKAQDLKLNRTVALKFLPMELTSDAEAVNRFINEAQAASALDHANICTIHEIDETEDGRIFICMAYYDGETLRKKVISAQLPVISAIDIAQQIANGLARAHEAGIVHRDIKPENIIITTHREVKIIDFGIAKLAGQSRLTKTGSTLGTMMYMSPEQLQEKEVDHRADIWALGAVLYEMLAGQAPFRGEYEAAMMYSILNEAPPPISNLHTDVPEALQHIAQKALAKNANERYQSAGELLVDLQSLRGASAGATFFSPIPVAKRASKKSKSLILWSSVGFGLMLLLVSGYFFFGQKGESTERVPIAVGDFVNQTNELELNGLSGMLITALEQSRRLAVMSRVRMFDELKKMGRAEVTFVDEAIGREICKRAKMSALVIATIRKFGQLYTIDFTIIDPQSGDRLFSTKVEGKGQESIPGLIDQLSEKTRIDLKEREKEIRMASEKVGEVTTPNLEAYQHYFKGQELMNRWAIREAQDELNKAVLLDSTFGLAYFRLAQVNKILSWMDIRSEDFQKDLLRKAVSLIKRIPEKERFLVRAQNAVLESGLAAGIAILKDMEQLYPNDKEMLFQIGDWSNSAGDASTAVAYLERVVAVDPAFEPAWNSLTAAYESLKTYDKMRDAAQTYVSIVGSAQAYKQLAGAYQRLFLFDSTLQTLEKARQLFPQAFDLAIFIADIYTYKDEFEKAEEVLLKLSREAKFPEQRQNAYDMLSLFYPYRGKYRNAIASREKAIEVFNRQHETEKAIAWTMRIAALKLQGWNDMEGALEEADKFSSHQDSIQAINYWWELAEVYALTGQHDLAIKIEKQKFNSQAYSASLKQIADACEKNQADFFRIYEFQRIEILYVLAKCQLQRGLVDQAIKSLHELQNIYNSFAGFRACYYPKSFYLLGKIYEQKDELQLAMQNYSKFLNMWKSADQDLPELIDAKARLAELKRMAMK